MDCFHSSSPSLCLRLCESESVFFHRLKWKPDLSWGWGLHGYWSQDTQGPHTPTQTPGPIIRLLYHIATVDKDTSSKGTKISFPFLLPFLSFPSLPMMPRQRNSQPQTAHRANSTTNLSQFASRPAVGSRPDFLCQNEDPPQTPTPRSKAQSLSYIPDCPPHAQACQMGLTHIRPEGQHTQHLILLFSSACSSDPEPHSTFPTEHLHARTYSDCINEQTRDNTACAGMWASVHIDFKTTTATLINLVKNYMNVHLWISDSAERFHAWRCSVCGSVTWRTWRTLQEHSRSLGPETLHTPCVWVDFPPRHEIYDRRTSWRREREKDKGFSDALFFVVQGC